MNISGTFLKKLDRLAPDPEQSSDILNDIAYGIEDGIMPYMYDFGRREFGIDVNCVERKYVIYNDGSYDEIRICAEGTISDRKSFIIGEFKGYPSETEIDQFIQKATRLKEVINDEIFLFVVGYQFSPDVETYIRDQYPSVRMYKTYEFELKYKRLNLL